MLKKMYAHAFFKSLNKCAHCDDDSIAYLIMYLKIYYSKSYMIIPLIIHTLLNAINNLGLRH